MPHWKCQRCLQEVDKLETPCSFCEQGEANVETKLGILSYDYALSGPQEPDCGPNGPVFTTSHVGQWVRVHGKQGRDGNEGRVVFPARGDVYSVMDTEFSDDNSDGKKLQSFSVVEGRIVKVLETGQGGIEVDVGNEVVHLPNYALREMGWLELQPRDPGLPLPPAPVAMDVEVAAPGAVEVAAPAREETDEDVYTRKVERIIDYARSHLWVGYKSQDEYIGHMKKVLKGTHPESGYLIPGLATAADPVQRIVDEWNANWQHKAARNVKRAMRGLVDNAAAIQAHLAAQ